jgi:arsenical pump membrane protein
MHFSLAHLAIWTIAALAAAGVVFRPFRLPEAIWAVSGAVALVLLGLLPGPAALMAVRRGGDVYLFLAGMMLLAEIARKEGLFDWLAVHAARAAHGSPRRLFLLVYGIGIAVTAILSNDSTAVVLTPAVYAAAKKARADPLPLLFACAMVANAASFVFPISNPANLVVFDGHLPPLADWLARFALPSLLAIGATFLVLRLVYRRRLQGGCEAAPDKATLPRGGKIALAGIAAAAVVLLASSAFGVALGLPTALCGFGSLAAIWIARRRFPADVLRGIAWSILPLVAGLFVLVAAVDATALASLLGAWLQTVSAKSAVVAAPGAGAFVAIASNLINNLPAGLIASLTLAHAHVAPAVTDSIMLGVDLGPNLSVTGSLATILWLVAIRREGQNVSAWQFLKIGMLAMPVALLLALGGRLLLPGF